MHKKFLAGVLVGMIMMFGICSAIAKYDEFSRRLGYVEGYIQQLDKFLREQSHAVQQSGRTRV